MGPCVCVCWCLQMRVTPLCNMPVTCCALQTRHKLGFDKIFYELDQESEDDEQLGLKPVEEEAKPQVRALQLLASLLMSARGLTRVVSRASGTRWRSPSTPWGRRCWIALRLPAFVVPRSSQKPSRS